MMDKISKKSKKFLNSKWSFVIFLSGILLIAILNYVMFALGDITINLLIKINGSNIISVNSSTAWLGWLEITISNIGTMCTISGIILTIRFDKRFIIPLVIGETLVIADSIIIGALFTGLSYIIMLSFAIFNYVKWKEDKNDGSKMNTKYWLFCASVLIIYISIGIWIKFLITDTPMFNDYNDVISSGVVTVCWFILLRKSKWGFIGFFITDITYLILFFSSGLWTTGAGYIVYLFIDSISFISWIETN